MLHPYEKIENYLEEIGTSDLGKAISNAYYTLAMIETAIETHGENEDTRKVFERMHDRQTKLITDLETYRNRIEKATGRLL